MLNMPKSVASRVVQTGRNIKKLHHDKRNNFAEYNYVSVDSFYEAIGPIMADAGLFVILDEASVTTEKGFLTANYELYLVSEEGDSYGPMHRQVTVKASGPQSYASAQSYAEKYFLRQIFKIPTGEADADAHEKVILPDAKPKQVYVAPDVKPQVEPLDDEASAKLRDEAINALKEITHLDGFTTWKSKYGADFKRKITKDDLLEVTKTYREIETKLKEDYNGEI